MAGKCNFAEDIEKINISGLERHKKIGRARAMQSSNAVGIPIAKQISKEEIEATLKESKAPDPFEDEHAFTESQLKNVISNTTSPDNPFYHLRQSGLDVEGTQKAYRHFIISLFESMCFAKKIIVTPISEEQVSKQKVNLKRPELLLCNLVMV
jgi:hypothetical protein